MLNRGTLLLLVGAIALGGGVLWLESSDVSDSSRTDSSETAGETQGEPLLPFAEEAITQFELDRSEADSLAFFKDESDTWQMSEPEEQTAEAAAVAFLLSQLTRSSNRVISIDSSDLADFGLDNPEATIILTAADDTYQLLLGGADFGGDQRYMQVKQLTEDQLVEGQSAEDESTEIQVHLVAGGIVNAIARPTTDWLAASQSESLDDEDEASDQAAEEPTTEETADEETADEETADEES